MPTQNLERVTAPGGSCIDDAAKDLCLRAKKENTSYVLVFNDQEITVTPTTTVKQVVAEYKRSYDAASAAYWTPARIAAEEEEKKAQRVEALLVMSELPSVDVNDLDACIRWLCRLEKSATVNTNRVVSKPAILQHFAGGMLYPGVNTALKGETPEAWAARVGTAGKKRWLIGQALEGIVLMGTPHQIIHHFAKQFGVST